MIKRMLYVLYVLWLHEPNGTMTARTSCVPVAQGVRAEQIGTVWVDGNVD